VRLRMSELLGMGYGWLLKRQRVGTRVSEDERGERGFGHRNKSGAGREREGKGSNAGKADLI
jgi:hypothetical protein